MAGVATSTAHDAALWEGPEFTEGSATPCRRWQRLNKTLGEQYLNTSSVFIRWQHFISTGHKWRFRQKHKMFALKCKVYNQTHLEVQTGLSFPECAVRKAVPRKRSYLTWTWQSRAIKQSNSKRSKIFRAQQLQLSLQEESLFWIWAPEPYEHHVSSFSLFFFSLLFDSNWRLQFSFNQSSFYPYMPKVPIFTVWDVNARHSKIKW